MQFATIKQILAGSFILILINIAQPAWASAGKAIMVIGKVHIVKPDGNLQRLRRGVDVNSGETVKTFSNGQAQIRLADGAIISVRPSSEFKLKNFRYAEDEKTDKAVFELVKGGMRAVSGRIGKLNRSNVRYRTPVATLGIRGTDFVASLCGQECRHNGRASPGLYSGVVNGSIAVTNQNGSIELRAGQFGYSASQQDAPVRVDSLPDKVFFPARKIIKGSKTVTYNDPTEEMVTIGLIVSPELSQSIVLQARDLGVSMSSIFRSAEEAKLDPAEIIKPLLLSGVSPQRVLNKVNKLYPERQNDFLLAAFSTPDESIQAQVQSIAQQNGMDSQSISRIKSISNLITAPESLAGSGEEEPAQTESGENTGRRALTPPVDPTLIPETSPTGDGTPVSPS